MNQEPESRQHQGEVDLEAIQRDFVNYLDGSVAPLFVADSLSRILNNGPPLFFDPKRIADFVNSWALNRAASWNRPIHEFYLKSVELIVTADRTGVLSGFDPSAFYIPFFEVLANSCPKAEKESFREKLKKLRDYLAKEWSYDFRSSDFEQTAEVKTVVKERKEPSDEMKDLIAKLQTPDLLLTRMEEENIVAELRWLLDALLHQPRFTIIHHLESLINIAVDLFNNNHPLFGAEILYVVQQVYNWTGFDKESREWLRGFKTANDLNPALLKKLSGKQEFQGAVRVFLNHFDELSPYALLNSLANETDRHQRRLFTSLIEAHGEGAVPVLTDLLSKTSPAALNNNNWFFTRNLIYLLGKLAPQDPEYQNALIKRIAPYLSAHIFQLRIAALACIESCPNEAALDAIQTVFNGKGYTEVEIKNTERISTHLGNAVGFTAKFSDEKAVRMLIGIAAGQSVNFIGEKAARPLRLQALQALASKRDALNAEMIAPLIERIRGMTKWKLKLVSKLLGEDEEMILAMIEVVSAVPVPQTIEVLTGIKVRYANKPLGLRAAELLSAMQSN